MASARKMLRNAKNVVNNYTEAEIKVRNATSNDSWGPSSTLMGEISDLSHNQVAYTEIITMLWKRLNDHGKNWRHVYKSMIVLEYLVKHGSERVTTSCKENMFAIETLKEFQFIDPDTQKDEGVNVRERAAQLVNLLKDPELLKSERERARVARTRIKDQIGVSSTGYSDSYRSQARSPSNQPAPSRGSAARQTRNTGRRGDISIPSTANEEELQLQLALQLSKNEADQRETKITKDQVKDDMRLEMAIKESLKEEGSKSPKKQEQPKAVSAGLDLLGDPWQTETKPAAPQAAVDPFMTAPVQSAQQSNDPWGLNMPQPTNPAPAAQPAFSNADPWGTMPVAQPVQQPQTTVAMADPWAAVSTAAPPSMTAWGNSDPFTSMVANNQVPIQPAVTQPNGVDLFSTGPMSHELNSIGNGPVAGQPSNGLDNIGKDLGSKFFNGSNDMANLVNFDTIINSPPVNVDALNNNKSPSPSPYTNNPFASFNTGRSNNPFQSSDPKPTLAQMQQQKNIEKAKETNAFSSSPGVGQLYPQTAMAGAADPFTSGDPFASQFNSQATLQPAMLQPSQTQRQSPTNPFL